MTNCGNSAPYIDISVRVGRMHQSTSIIEMQESSCLLEAFLMKILTYGERSNKTTYAEKNQYSLLIVGKTALRSAFFVTVFPASQETARQKYEKNKTCASSLIID